jgi:hypothetical protein
MKNATKRQNPHWMRSPFTAPLGCHWTPSVVRTGAKIQPFARTSVAQKLDHLTITMWRIVGPSDAALKALVIDRVYRVIAALIAAAGVVVAKWLF